MPAPEIRHRGSGNPARFGAICERLGSTWGPFGEAGTSRWKSDDPGPNSRGCGGSGSLRNRAAQAPLLYTEGVIAAVACFARALSFPNVRVIGRLVEPVYNLDIR